MSLLSNSPVRRRALRLGGAVVFFAGIFMLPWWLTLLLGIFLLVWFQAYEVLIGAVFLDSIYGTATPLLGNSAYLSTIVFCMIAAIVFVLRGRLLLYHR